MIELILVDINRTLCYKWEEAFKGLQNSYIVNDEISALDDYIILPNWTCIVAAGNSFGLMDGGVDLAIRNYFGPYIEERVQQRIVEKYRGELLVGQSEVVETDDVVHPYIAYTPTMRTPQGIRFTDNIYNAMWAALLETDRYDIPVLACTGLGTETIPADEAAHQMATAYKNWLNPPIYVSWDKAEQREVSIWG